MYQIAINLLMYGRYDHARAVVESLLREKAENVIIYLDRPGNAQVLQEQERILEYLDSLPDGFHTLVRPVKRLGLARSVRNAMDRSFESHDAAILLEDDCVIRPGGLTFFTEGLERFSDNRRIRSLCGYLFPACNFFFGPEDELLMLQRFSTWGWATWADRWRDYQADLRKIVDRFSDKNLSIELFCEDMAYITRQDDFLEGRKDIWSIPWILEHYLSSSFAIYPRESVIENIGLDGSGQNCHSTAAFSLENPEKKLSYTRWNPPPYYIENESIVKNFMDEHGLKTYPVD
jgi:hypothetical protein